MHGSCASTYVAVVHASADAAVVIAGPLGPSAKASGAVDAWEPRSSDAEVIGCADAVFSQFVFRQKAPGVRELADCASGARSAERMTAATTTLLVLTRGLPNVLWRSAVEGAWRSRSSGAARRVAGISRHLGFLASRLNGRWVSGNREDRARREAMGLVR